MSHDGDSATPPTRRQRAATDPDALPSAVRREARIVGLDEMRVPSLEAIEKRRYRLWIFTTLVLAAVTLGVLVLPLVPDIPELPTSSVLRMLVFALAAGFIVYAVDRELHLRRLTRLLVEERVLTASLTNRVRELSSMLDAGKAVNSVLDLDRVLNLILTSALDLLEAGSGAILLRDGDRLRAVSALGGGTEVGVELALGEGVSGRVAQTGEPLLILGPGEEGLPTGRKATAGGSALSVPLVHRGEQLGVLEVAAASDRRFTEYDLRAVSLFGEQAAAAVANARLYEQQRSQALALAHRAYHDPLTDLPNRLLFFERVDEYLRRSREGGPSFALLFIDLDGFKRVNDSLGHLAGDEVLVQVGRRLRAVAGADDTPARLGGDEFALVVAGVDTTEEASDRARDLVSRLAAPVPVHGRTVRVGASVGIALADSPDADPEDLVRRADAALYDAKRRPRAVPPAVAEHTRS